ncbi:MAG TPA: hypothetical protein VFI76_03770 [Terrimicrobiaceae bacterium]|nr:hypothetical protein [Terrimicrobiaceae bacterium]
MRRLALVACWVLALWLAGCAQDEERRAAQEAGGTIPWNRPATWEGPGMLGTQIQGTP